MFERMAKEFENAIFHNNNPYSYKQLLNHFSGLWQEYAKQKNKDRQNNPSRNLVDESYFYDHFKDLEQEYSGKTLISKIRSISIYRTNNVYVRESQQLVERSS